MDTTVIKTLDALQDWKVAELQKLTASYSARNRNPRTNSFCFAVSPGACRPIKKEI